jgi:fructose-1,6-bisphosphatase/inositol monophosphatase family enzyme
MIAVTQELAKRGTIDVPNPVQALGCAVVPMTYLLLGRFLAYVGKVKLWDIAGTLPLLLRAGFVVQTIDGRPMDDRVSDEFYELDPAAPRAFSLRKRMVCAGSPGVIDFLRTAIHE